MNFYYAALVSVVVLGGMYLSNLLYDLKVPNYLSRKVSHAAGGVGYLLCTLLFPSPDWPIALSAGFTVGLGVIRALHPHALRGVGGSARLHALAELYFPMAGTVALYVGWYWLGNRWLAIVPILFMAWGDAVTGVVRSQLYGREVKGNWGTVAMGIACLFIAGLFTPYWVGVTGALVATAAERFTPLSKGIWDDNWTIVLASLGVMGLLSIQIQ